MSHSRGRRSREEVKAQREVIASILVVARRALDRAAVLNEYERLTDSQISYNTVKARLEELVDAARVRRSPQDRRPVTYEIIADRTEPATGDEQGARGLSPDLLASSGSGISLSPSARRVQGLVRRPREGRDPVGYDAEFIDAYQPGSTWYLPAPDRKRLYELGRTTRMDQPAGTYARDIMQRLVIDLSWGSSRLEGLRYTRIDTAELLTAGTSPRVASNRDRQLILNHKAAIEFLVEEAQSISFNRYTILNLHALLSENLLDDREEEGALRTRAVMIGSSVYTPTAIPQVIEERFDKLLGKARAIHEPIEQSFFVMVHLPYLQPFIDVNKRTSRLAANIPLIRENLCPLSFVDVPEEIYAEAILGVYERRDVSMLRDVFAWAYERSCAQFKVLREAMGEPNLIRLNYRAELRALVGEIVRGMAWPDEQELHVRAAQLGVAVEERPGFVAEAERDMRALRPEIIARYSLRKSEFDRWAEAVADRRPNPHR
jgi:hypothetical protein